MEEAGPDFKLKRSRKEVGTDSKWWMGSEQSLKVGNEHGPGK